MTTQAEPQHPPTQTYSTSPPWATAPTAPVGAPPTSGPPGLPGADFPALPGYGQLLVPYPEEMRNASRATPPSWWPIALVTFFFFIPGLIVTVRRAAQARRGRNSPAPYWITFAVTVLVSLVVWAQIYVIAVPAYLNYRENAITKTVQQHLVKDGQLKEKSRLTASSATCNPTSSRDDADQRLYSCLLKLDDDRTGTIDVSADSDGNWTAVPMAKTAPLVKTAVPSVKPAKK